MKILLQSSTKGGSKKLVNYKTSKASPNGYEYLVQRHAGNNMHQHFTELLNRLEIVDGEVDDCDTYRLEDVYLEYSCWFEMNEWKVMGKGEFVQKMMSYGFKFFKNIDEDDIDSGLDIFVLIKKNPTGVYKKFLPQKAKVLFLLHFLPILE